MQVHLEFNMKMLALHIIDKDLTPEAPQHGRASAGISAAGASTGQATWVILLD
jgi:hypothetical protein